MHQFMMSALCCVCLLAAGSVLHASEPDVRTVRPEAGSLVPDSREIPPLPVPVRVADVVGGHVHPALCRTAEGDLLAVYNREGGGGKELLLCRSTDGGKSWTQPAAIPVISDCSIYPGSLATLSDGTVVLHWSCYRREGSRLWRVPQFTRSRDHGRAWEKVRDIPAENLTNYTCLRHPVLEISPTRWVLPLYDRTVLFDVEANQVSPFGDGRNHGMVPLVKTPEGTIISGAPEAAASVPVGQPGIVVRGLRSVDGGKSWQALQAFPRFGVAGYDLNVLENGWIVLTSIIYGIGRDGEWAYELTVSRDDGQTWDRAGAVTVYNPGRPIGGRGWPRTVQIDERTLGTLFYDLNASQPGGPGVFFVRTPLSRFQPKEPAVEP
ncbi:MAG: exo-alpha-sialidase [Planctomycetaceae bacterium]|nr:exo-alpha-sialidase [Planctomycetaceae bacterium]